MAALNTGYVIAGGAGTAYDAGANPSWTDPLNVTSITLNYATITLPPSTWSKYIYADNFGFNIPTGFPVLGIKVKALMWSQRTANTAVVDVYVNQDAKDVFTVNNSTNGTFGNEDIPNFNTERIWGGVTDLWGQDGAINAAYINNATFGVAIRIQNYNSSNTNETRFFWVQIEVYHEGPLGVLTSTIAIVGVKSTSKKEFFQAANTSSINVNGNKSIVVNDTYASIGDLVFRYSGGATNINARGSLGGQVSLNTRITSQVLSRAVDNTKAAIVDAYGNAYGDGVLTFIPGTPPSYTWSPSGFIGSLIPVEAPYNRLYTIGDTTYGQMTIIHDSVDMPTSTQADTITIAKPVRNTVLDDIGYEAVVNGITEYICIYIGNIAGATIVTVKLWVGNQPTAPHTVELGLDPAGIGDGVTNGVATVIVANTDIPSGVSFFQANAASPLVIGDIPVNSMQAIWVKRIAPSGVVPLNDFELTDLTIEALV